MQHKLPIRYAKLGQEAAQAAQKPRHAKRTRYT